MLQQSLEVAANGFCTPPLRRAGFIEVRQDEKTTDMTPEIEACFEVIEAVMRFEPKREFSVFPLQQTRFLAASDAAVEADSPGSVVSTLSFSNLTDHKFVSVLLLPIVLNFKPSRSRQGLTLPSSNFRLYCMP